MHAQLDTAAIQSMVKFSVKVDPFDVHLFMAQNEENR